MPLSSGNVAKLTVLENKLSKLWRLINVTNILKYKEDTTVLKNSILPGLIHRLHYGKSENGSYPCAEKA